MRAVTYKSVLDRVAAYFQEAEGLSIEDQQLAAVKINLFVKLGWEAYWHPDTMDVEQRIFRSAYSSTASYLASTAATPVEVLDWADRNYYQALVATTPATDIWVHGATGVAANVNGRYVADGTQSGKPKYDLAPEVPTLGLSADRLGILYWSGTAWNLNMAVSPGVWQLAYYSFDAVATPDLVTTWVQGGAPLNAPLPVPIVQTLPSPWISPYWAPSGPNYNGETSATANSGDDWQPNTAYIAPVGDGVNPATEGSVVRNPGDGRMYMCITGHTSGTSFDATKFTVLTPFFRSIDYNQALTADGVAAEEIGLVRDVWDKDPRVAPWGRYPPRRQRFLLRHDFVQVEGCQTVVWLEFQLQAPVFIGDTRSDTLTYAAGVELYDTVTGDYWISTASINAAESPTTTPAKWARVVFPYYLAEYVAQSVYAMLSDREQEQPESFGVENGAGWPLLSAEFDRVERMQGQTRQLNVQLGRR